MSSVAYLANVLAALDEAVEPLRQALSDPLDFDAFIAGFGWATDPATSSAPPTEVVGPIASALDELESAAAAVRSLSDGRDDSAAVGALTSMGKAVATLASGLRDLAAVNIDTSWNPPFNDLAFWQSLSDDVFDTLLVRYLAMQAPRLHGFLRLCGLITETVESGTEALRGAYVRRQFHWDRLGDVLSPSKLIADAYGWGASLDVSALFMAIASQATGFGLSVGINPPDQSVLDDYYDRGTAAAGIVELTLPLYRAVSEVGEGLATIEFDLVVLPIPPAGAPAGDVNGFLVYPRLVGAIDASTNLGPGVTLDVSGDLTSTAAIRAEVRPGDARVTLGAGPPVGSASVEVAAAFVPPRPVVGDPSGMRVEVSKLHVSARFGLSPQPELRAEAVADEISLVLDLSESDGFLTTFLGRGVQRLDVSAGLVWSSRTGFAFVGSAGLDVSIPVDETIAGVLHVDTVTVRVALVDGRVQLQAGITGSLDIGPITASVDRLGIGASIEPRSETDGAGNLGHAELSWGPKPPDGVGLDFSAPAISGGGFLSHDEAASQYLGAVELSIGTLSIQGVGVLTTRMPSGTQGFSLVVLANVTGLQVALGFGIVLTGVGALVGVNRALNVPALQALARAGNLENVLFPADLAHNAPRVAADLATVFPPAEGHFVFGVGARIYWGSDTLVTADLGVYVQVPSVIVALLGALRITLPTREPEGPAVIDLRLNILGVLDLPGERLSIDASLTNSKIVGLPVTGQAAVRAAWGDDPQFVAAFGGFHPAFSAPAGFPKLQRLALSLGSTNPRLLLSTYFAVTSNSYQLGSAADLYVSAGPAALQASLAWDALIQWKPLHIELDLYAHAAILIGGSPVVSLTIAVHVTGPGPWHLSGSASFSILFFSITIPFSLTLGSPIDPVPPSTVDVLTPLVGELGKTGSYLAGSPTGPAVVTVRRDTSGSVLHPLGSLTVRQRLLPLEIEIDHSGGDVLAGTTTFSIAYGEGEARRSTADRRFAVTDFFAPAQFIHMSDTQKLSSPSFEQMTAGLTIDDTGLYLPADQDDVQQARHVSSDSQWDVRVVGLDAFPSPADALRLTASSPAALIGSVPSSKPAVPDDILARQLATAAAAVNGASGRGATYHLGPKQYFATTTPHYTVAPDSLNSSGPSSVPPVLTPSRAAALRQLERRRTPNTQVLYRSETLVSGAAE